MHNKYHNKYLKYKKKYLNLKNKQSGGAYSEYNVNVTHINIYDPTAPNYLPTEYKTASPERKEEIKNLLLRHNRYRQNPQTEISDIMGRLSYAEENLTEKIHHDVDHVNQIINCRDMIIYANHNPTNKQHVISNLQNNYNRLRGIKPILPNIQNITFDRFSNICDMIDTAENFLNNGGQLNRVSVGDNFIDMTLDSIKLSNNYTDDNLKLFFSLLLYTPHISIIDLSRNKITDITLLQNAFQNNPNLKSLYLYENKIHDITPLSKAFNNNPEFTDLSLNNNYYIKNITPLVNAFVNNPNFVYLNLSSNFINDVSPLKKIIKENIKFVTLEIKFNLIDNISFLKDAFEYKSQNTPHYILTENEFNFENNPIKNQDQINIEGINLLYTNYNEEFWSELPTNYKNFSLDEIKQYMDI